MSNIDVSIIAGSCFLDTSFNENRLWMGILEPGSRWIIYGRVSVTYILGDGALIFGAGLHPNELQSFDVYSPSTHTPLDLSVSLGSKSLDKFPLDELKSRLSKVFGPDSESFLLPIIEALISATDKISPMSSFFLFKPLPSRVCDSIEEVRHAKPLKILLCGPKNVGKSTYMRYLVNRLVTSTTKEAVAVLDCDVGQTEFTPAGMMSLSLISKPLLGPPFTHPLGTASRRCFFGDLTPSTNPTFYVQCLRYVFDAYKQFESLNCPLLINTMGWTQG
ncbi:unnamed protein product [Dibothriocephalus latus]|uniref:Clp1 P-loop domain-containing protein n=1 Tax=Dibothriocephalus latus TaxID=60516 RepID=A0A3P6P2V6_DIBLA|nr:unnamed protein product [Dibothriocephalus latus]